MTTTTTVATSSDSDDGALDAHVCAWLVDDAATLSRRERRRVLRHELRLLRRETALWQRCCGTAAMTTLPSSFLCDAAAREQRLCDALACAQTRVDVAALRDAAVQLTTHGGDADTLCRLLAPQCVLLLHCGDYCECISGGGSSSDTTTTTTAVTTAAPSRDAVVREMCAQHASLLHAMTATAAVTAHDNSRGRSVAPQLSSPSPQRPSTRASSISLARAASAAAATTMTPAAPHAATPWVAAVSDTQHWVCCGSCPHNDDDDDDDAAVAAAAATGDGVDGHRDMCGDNATTTTTAASSSTHACSPCDVVTLVTYYGDAERTTPCFSLHTTYTFDLVDALVLVVRRQLRVHEPYDEDNVLPRLHFGHARRDRSVHGKA